MARNGARRWRTRALALAQIRGGDREAARQSLDRALALDSGDAQAHAWRSFLLRAEGRLAEADAAARRATAAGAAFLAGAPVTLRTRSSRWVGAREAREEAARAVD